MRGLLIAEKPSVMRVVESVYRKMPAGADTLDFAAFHGHLMQLQMPEDYGSGWGSPWSAAQLPMIPAKFVYVAADKKSADALADKAKGYDFLVNACDAGREGEHIFWSWYETYGLTMPVKRYWASSNTKAAVSGALTSLYPASKFDNLKESAKLRAELDWLVGMNFSRAASVASGSNSYIGRIMSPVRKMIVDRELEIRNFKPETYFELKATFVTGNGEEFSAIRLVPPDHKEVRHKTREEAEQVCKGLLPRAKVVRVKTEDQTIPAPTLFSQTELQMAANSEFKMSPDKVLEIAQSLYEAGYITYPRTESRYLPTDMVSEIPAHLKALYNVPDIGPFAQKVTSADITRATTGNAYVDDGKIEDHHAIIPTDEEPDWSKLSGQEQGIYKLIARQFVAIFMPPYRAQTTSVLVLDGKALFRADGTVEVDPGYTVLAAAKKKKGVVVLPALAENDVVTLRDSKVTESTTKPPVRYTPKTILAAMRNAGKFVDDAKQRSVLREAAGLGTAATRAPTLKKMVDRGDIRLENNQYVPSDYSVAFIEHYGKRDFCSPALTATWEEKLRSLEDGKYHGDFRQEIQKYVRDEVTELLGDSVDLTAFRYSSVGVCPKCSRRVLSKKEYFTCEGYKADKDPCDFIFSKEFRGAKLSDEDARLVLSGKKTKKKKLLTKDGKEFSSAIVLEGGKLALDRGSESLGVCPVCGKGKVFSGPNFYYCSDKSLGCTFAFRKVVSGADIGDGDMKALLAGKTTNPLEFTWKSGAKGKARLRLEGDKLKFVFDN